jgi:hypothetical protein
VCRNDVSCTCGQGADGHATCCFRTLASARYVPWATPAQLVAHVGTPLPDDELESINNKAFCKREPTLSFPFLPDPDFFLPDFFLPIADEASRPLRHLLTRPPSTRPVCYLEAPSPTAANVGLGLLTLVRQSQSGREVQITIILIMTVQKTTPHFSREVRNHAAAVRGWVRGGLGLGGGTGPLSCASRVYFEA